MKAFVDPAVQSCCWRRPRSSGRATHPTCDKCLLPVPRTGIFSISPYMCPRCDRTFLLDFEPMTCPNCGLKFGDESNGLDGSWAHPLKSCSVCGGVRNRGKFQELGESGAFIIWESAIRSSCKGTADVPSARVTACPDSGHFWVARSPQPTQSFRDVHSVCNLKRWNIRREFKPIK